MVVVVVVGVVGAGIIVVGVCREGNERRVGVR